MTREASGGYATVEKEDPASNPCVWLRYPPRRGPKIAGSILFRVVAYVNLFCKQVRCGLFGRMFFAVR
jgi:hypothetical protein